DPRTPPGTRYAASREVRTGPPDRSAQPRRGCIPSMSTSISSSKDLTLSETRNESKPTARHAVSRTPVQVRPVRDWTARTALPIAVVAVGLAGWALFDVRSGTADAPSPPDSTARVCGAFQVVSTAIPLQTHLDLGEDPVAQTA